MNRWPKDYLTQTQPYSYVVSVAQQPANIPSWYVTVPLAQASTISPSMRTESVQRIEAIQALTDDWDGYGGFAPSGLVCAHAYQLIESMARNFPELPSPEISPRANGTVVLLWLAAKGQAVLEIGDARFSGFVRRSGASAPVSGDPNLLGKSELSIIAGCLQ